MTRAYFKCTFLTDIVLSSRSATQGSTPSLDYIPGSNFLGIAAQHYQAFGDRAFTVFHSGKVRFSDAHMAIGNARSQRIPLAWFQKKEDQIVLQGNLQSEKIFIHHRLPVSDREAFRKSGDQLKQVRSGFFVPDGRMAAAEHCFAIKSAYDLNKRRSQDNQMYGYDALRRGSEWIFCIACEDETLLPQLIAVMVGEKYIGRSRTSQYGCIRIDKIETVERSEHGTQVATGGLLSLYAESCLAFFDRYGEPTLQPTPADLLLPQDSKIRWEESQVRTRIFAPWNRVRKSRDGDRVCLDKGSVLIVEVPTGFDIEKYVVLLQQGVGAYRNEGLGQLLVNPHFLDGTKENVAHPRFAAQSTSITSPAAITAICERDASDATVSNWLTHKHTQQQQDSAILKAVNDFLHAHQQIFNKISASQWGAVRAIAQAASGYGCDCGERCSCSGAVRAIAQAASGYQDMLNKLFQGEASDRKEDRIGFLVHGKSEKEWKRLGRRNLLREALQEIKDSQGEACACRFCINLCSEMAKFASQDKGE